MQFMQNLMAYSSSEQRRDQRKQAKRFIADMDFKYNYLFMAAVNHAL